MRRLYHANSIFAIPWRNREHLLREGMQSCVWLIHFAPLFCRLRNMQTHTHRPVGPRKGVDLKHNNTDVFLHPQAQNAHTFGRCWGGGLVNSKVHRSHNIYLHHSLPSTLMHRQPAAAWSYLEKYLIFISICCMIWSPSAISWHRHLNAANSWIERRRDGLQRATIEMIRSRVNPFCTGGWEDIYFSPLLVVAQSTQGRGGGEMKAAISRTCSVTPHHLACLGISVEKKQWEEGKKLKETNCVWGFFSQSIGWIYQFGRRRTRLNLRWKKTFVLFVFCAELKHSTNYENDWQYCTCCFSRLTFLFLLCFPTKKDE